MKGKFTIPQIMDEIRSYEKTHNNIAKDQLDSTIFTFIFNHKKGLNDNSLIDSWNNFLKGRLINSTTQNNKTIDRETKRKELMKYDRYFNIEEVFEQYKDDVAAEINRFLITDSSETYYDLFKSWEMFEYQIWTEIKDNNIKRYIKRNKLE